MIDEELVKYIKALNNINKEAIININSIIDLYTKEKEKNNELLYKLQQKIIIETHEQIRNNYISKDKIKQKIEELEKTQKENRKMLNQGIENLNNISIDTYSKKIIINMNIREVLKQLLEEEQL